MARIIDFAEVRAQRDRARTRAPNRAQLERAVALLRMSLAATAAQLADAPADEQPELLQRVERLVALVKYGMCMLGVSDGSAPSDGRSVESR
ncbi:MAG: hypothetical protein ACREQB_00135 [Candidatus Binataceae bacterium]